MATVAYFQKEKLPMIDKRIRRTALIYRVVQGGLIILLALVAFSFQVRFVQMGRGNLFLLSFLAAVVVQLLLIYPVYKLAWRDAGISLEESRQDLTSEQLTSLRKKRLMGDLWKASGIIFFITFVVLVPESGTATVTPFFLAITIFSFLLTCLMYFQCFNYSIKRQMK
jgi:hypothetical protein